MLAIDLSTPPAAVAPEEPRPNVSARPVEVGTVYQWSELLPMLERKGPGTGQRTKRRAELWEKCPYCSYCGRWISRRSGSLEHVIPKSRGGTNAKENLRLVCKTCNESKGGMMLGEWLPILQRLTARVRELTEGWAA